MKIQSIHMLVTIISTLALSACQTTSLNTITSSDSVDEMPLTLINVDSDGDGVPDNLDMCPHTQQNAVLDERGCHITTGPDKRLKIEHRAFFAEGSSELLPRYQAELDTIAERMNEYKTATMRIEGNISESETDNNDSTNLSNALSRNRAMIIKSYIIMKHKIAAERIMIYDCGTKIQIAPNDTQEGRHMNRRVYSIVTEPTVTEPAEKVLNDYQQYSESKLCVEF